MGCTALGIDPGHDGAAVYLDLDSGSLVAWFGWRRMRRTAGPDVYAVSGEGIAGRVEDPTLAHIGARIAYFDCPSAIAIEGLFARRPNGAVSMGEACGLVSAATIKDAGKVPIWRPPATTWRRDVLGLGRATRDVAKEAAIAYALDRWPRLEYAPDKLTEHVCEAACIALWAKISADRLDH